MATIFSFLRTIGFSNHYTDESAEFVPMNTNQMARMQGGFDLESDPDEDDPANNDPDPADEPISGELPEDNPEG